MDEVDKELAKMIRETKRLAKESAKGAGQVATSLSILAAFHRAGVDPNALLREIRLPHEDMPEWDDIVLDAEEFLWRIGVLRAGHKLATRTDSPVRRGGRSR